VNKLQQNCFKQQVEECLLGYLSQTSIWIEENNASAMELLNDIKKNDKYFSNYRGLSLL
jgi:hypothetical protein